MDCTMSHVDLWRLGSWAGLALGDRVRDCRRACELARGLAREVGMSEGDIAAACCSSMKVTGVVVNRRERTRTLKVRYSSAVRCPLLARALALAADLPAAGRIEPYAVYTVRMAAAALDMSPRAVRRLVKSGELAGCADAGGYLIAGVDVIRWLLGGGCCVLSDSRRGALRSPASLYVSEHVFADGRRLPLSCAR